MRTEILGLCLLVIFGCLDPVLFAQEQQQTLKQKLEQGLVKTQIFHGQKLLISTQNPVDAKTRLIDFKWQLIEWPFIIKYPASWYVRESYYNTSSLFISQEPVNEVTDQYKVGMALHYYPGYFSIQKPPAVSELGQIAHDLVYINQWETAKKEYIEQVRQQSQSVISVKDIDLAGKPAARAEHKLNDFQVISYYIKADNDLIQIMYQAPLREFSKYETVFNLMIDSFYFKQ
ncbi:MAG: hypothetical protein V1747_00955 [Candidatus Omnitrophota bacterium]